MSLHLNTTVRFRPRPSSGGAAKIRGCIRRGYLEDQVAIEMSGKYFGERAYNFHERNVLSLKNYSLSEYFEHMFDYLFPPVFHMQQRGRFDLFEQKELAVLNFLRRLHE